MPSRYSHYPASTRDGTSRRMNDDDFYDRVLDGPRTPRALERPPTPELDRDRSSSPALTSGPPTPKLQPVRPVSSKSKMGRRSVSFTSPVADDSFRRAHWDELSVMRAFASHANHCTSCSDPLRAHYKGSRLCDRGTGLAKDLGTYFHCYGGKPYSNIDRQRGREKVQVEVPTEYSAVKSLFSALNDGYSLKRSRSSRPEVRQTSPKARARRHTMDAEVSRPRRIVESEPYEMRPARSGTRRRAEPVYRDYGDRRYETRAPDDEVYTSGRRRRSPRSSPSRRVEDAEPVVQTYRSSRRREDTSPDKGYTRSRSTPSYRTTGRETQYRDDRDRRRSVSNNIPFSFLWR